MLYDKEVGDVYAALSSTSQGLSSAEVKARLQRFGPNKITHEKKTSKIRLFFQQFNSFIIYILIGAVIVSTIIPLYEKGFHNIILMDLIDAIAIFIILILNAIFGYIQESKAEKSIEALQRMASLKALVIRDGHEHEIDAADLVPGDIVILTTGEKIPADARLIEAINLETQEASLTGESLPVKKQTKALPKSASLAERTNMVYSSTIITNGRGKAIVTGTGMQSEIGKIADLIQTTPKSMTPLQKKIAVLGKWLGYMVLIISAIVFAGGLLEGQDPVTMFLTAVSLAVAAIPEGLPAVVTITLALGIQRMVKKNALIRKLPSVETLGGTSVICTDKTGTLTHNEMTVTHLWVNNGVVQVSGSGYAPQGSLSMRVEDPLLFQIGVLCNDADLIQEKDQWTITGDPTEGCLLTLAEKAHVDVEITRTRYPRLNEIPFDSERKLMTTIHKLKEKSALVKGAPDIILSKCSRIRIKGKVRTLTAKDREQILKTNEEFSSQALRVLGFAYRPLKDRESENNANTVERDLIFVGLQGMIDPPREEVKEAIQRCRNAGIKVVMITGDYKGTALAIARELGIEGRAIDGKELQRIDLDQVVEEIGIYARVNPQDKMQIIEALKKKHHVVAMTGDGVNDAPAIKRSDIGIAMGITGTDVAKEASDMVLLDDNFTSIVNAVEEGRGIFENIRKFVNYLLSSNLAEVLVLFSAMVLAGSLGFFEGGMLILPLLPLHILWMNLITDGLPALALGIDPHNKQVMHQRPRKLGENIVSKKLFVEILIFAFLMTAATLFLFKLSLDLYGPAIARTVALTTLVVFQFVRIQIVRGEYHVGVFSNKYLVWAVGGSLLLQGLIIYVPFMNVIFKTAPLVGSAASFLGYIALTIMAVYLVNKAIRALLVRFFFPEAS